jgi:hypothetical protein
VALGTSRQVLKRALSQPAFLSRTLPAALLALLLLVGLATVVAQVGQYGIGIDETTQDPYGTLALKFYATLGKNTGFTNFLGPDVPIAEHGVIFDVVIAAAQYALPGVDHWLLRHLLTALAGLIGVVAIALCGFEIGGYWVAFLAGLGLWLYPRYYGSIYTNSKDIPAAVTATLVLWGALLLIRHWEPPGRFLRYSVLLGVLLGLAAAVRVNAIIWYLIFLLFLAIWWLLHGREIGREGRVRAELVKQGKSAAVIGVTSYVTMVLLWPYLLLNPVGNLYQAILVASRYPWPGYVLYRGMLIPATQLPFDYVFVWLIIGSTFTCIALAALGFGVIGATWAREREFDPRLAMTLLAFVIPLAALVGLHAVVYDGLRHFLFLIPPLILIGAYGLTRLVAMLARTERGALRFAAAGLVVLMIVSYTFDVRDMLALSPFEYTYFSPLIGGIAGANGNYDTEYWATCSKQSAEWLASNYQRYTRVSSPTVEGRPFQALAAAYLPTTFHEDQAHPDFFIAAVRNHDELLYPSYTVMHLVTAAGVPVCVIKANPAIMTS